MRIRVYEKPETMYRVDCKRLNAETQTWMQGKEDKLRLAHTGEFPLQ